MAAARLARSCLAADILPQGKLIRTLEVSQKAHAIIPVLPQKQVVPSNNLSHCTSSFLQSLQLAHCAGILCSALASLA